MLASLIRWSIQNRFLVLMATALLAAWGIHATLSTPLDALPDLSDTQVIIRTEFPGQAPQVVEDQVTYPLTTLDTNRYTGYAHGNEVIPSSVTPTSTSSSTTKPTSTGHDRGCSNT